MLTTLHLPCPPADVEDICTVLNGRQLVTTFDYQDFNHAFNQLTLSLPDTNDRIYIEYHVTKGGAARSDVQLNLLTPRPFNFTATKLEQYSGDRVAPIRTTDTFQLTSASDTSQQWNWRGVDPELHSLTELLFISLHH